MKYLLKDLAPGKTYYLQFRSKDADGNVSEWSRTFSLSTTGDIYAPNAPTGLTVTSVGRSFQAAWTGPTTSTDGSPATDLRHYLVKVESSLAPGVTKTYTTPDTKFELTFEKNLETFTTARGTIGISVAAQDMTGNVSTYTSVVTASNPAPAAVTGLAATAGVEKIALSWNANTEEDLKHYEVWRSKTGAAGTYTKQWTGSSTQYTDPSIDYFTDHWYRVYAVDVFNTLSTAAQTGSALRPVGSFAMDSTAPATPTSLAATLTNATDGKTAKAVVTWTATPDTDGDLAEYIIDYKPSAETNWDTTKVDYEKTAVTLVGLIPYVNYDFRIRASDWSANLSGWSATLTKTATANAAPATVTGVVATPGRDSITAYWNESAETDVANGAGVYMVDFATNSGFTTGLLSYKTGATSITVTGLPPSTQYWVRVKAVDSLGLASAAWSTSATATTTAAGGTSNFKYTTSATEPSSPTNGDIWMDTTTGFEKQYNGIVWVNTGNVSLAYMTAKATDLVTNGTGLMKNNYNFSGFDYSGSDAPTGANGSFVIKFTAPRSSVIDELISFDPSKKYTLSFKARQTVAGSTERMYGFIAPYDAFGQSIPPSSYMFHPNTTTTLAADLVNGATTVQLTDASNWYGTPGKPGTGFPHYRSMIFWNYTDPSGKVWPAHTYSRRPWYTDAWSETGITGNTITLRSPWAGGTIPAGTPVSNGTSGGSYMYMPSATNVVVPETWTEYKDLFSAGVMADATAASGRLSAATFTLGVPPGTAQIKVGWLVNYAPSPANPIAGKHAIASVSLSDATAAQMTADGKNKIIRSTSDASGTAGYVANDLWWKLDGSGNVIQQWKFNGSSWVSEVLMDGVFGSLSANKLVAGSAFVTDLDIGAGGNIKSAGYTSGGSSGFILNTSGLTIKGNNNVIDAGVLKGGTITGTTINVGAGGSLIIDSSGEIRSNNYSGYTTGYRLGNSGLVINDGDIDAKNLRTNTAIIGDLTIGRSADAAGTIKSFDYVVGNAGWKIGKGLFEVNNGLIKAAALQLQNGHNMMPIEYADFEYGDYYYLNPFWNPRGQGMLYENDMTVEGVTSAKVFGKQCLSVADFNTTAGSIRLGKTATDYNIAVDASGAYYLSAYLRNYGVNATTWTMSVIGNNGATIATQSWAHSANEATFTRRGLAVNIPASGVSSVIVEISSSTAVTKALYLDGVQFEPIIGGLVQASVWKPPAQTYIDASGVTTGYLRSSANINVAGTDLPAWSLNKAGNMQVGDALIRGKLVVGTTSETPVNLAPGNGDFESNVTGYTAFHLGATGTAIARTTTGGEVIDGTGSAKVTAAAGSKTRLGISFNPPSDIAAGRTVRVRAQVKVDATVAGSTLRVAFWNPSTVAFHVADVIGDPVAGQIYDISYDYEVDEGESVRTITIYHYHGTAITTTSFIADNIAVIDNTNVGISYVSSPDYSAGASGWRIFGDGSVEFNNGVFRGALGAGMVTSESLVSELVISSDFKTAATGRRVEFGSAGVKLHDEDESLLVNLSTDTTSPALFNGDLLASSLTISDQMAIRGSNNELARNATLTIQSGSTAPVSPPTVQIGWDQVSIDADPQWAPYRFGLAYSPAHNRFISVQNIYGTNSSLVYYNPATGALDWSQTSLRDIRTDGNPMVWGGEIYILGKKVDGTWAVEVRNESTKAWARTWNLSYPYNYRPAIGNDGTNVFIIFGGNSDHRICVAKYNKTTGAAVGSTILGNNFLSGGNYHLSGGGYIASGTSGGFSTSRYWYTRDNLKNVYVLDSSLNVLNSSTSETFPSPNNIRGAVFADVAGAGNLFYTWDRTSGKITKHTGVSWSGDSTTLSKWHVANTWYDNNATGGTHETQMGPVTAFTMTKRAGLLITSPPIPVRPTPNTTDDVVAAGVYMARNSSTLAPANRLLFERQLYMADGVRTQYFHRNGGPATTLPTSGVNATNPPPATNGFASVVTAPGLIRSANDIFNLSGDGSGFWGALTVSSTGTVGIPNRLPAAMATGSFSTPALNINTSSGGINVTFPVGRFSSTPRIVITAGSGRVNAALTASSSTGFTYVLENWSNANAAAGTTGYWIAIQE